MPTLSFPIDLVYLWVKGDDPAWLSRRDHYAVSMPEEDRQFFAPKRWTDNDELRYSLRSVEAYAPWINHIFLVTDGQVPQWLNTEHPKITVVDHKDFIPERYLPYFSASQIESFIPYIPNLSEHFIYSNDDMFFGRFTPPNRFFKADGTPIVSVKKLYPTSFVADEDLCSKVIADPDYASRARANKLIYDLFGIKGNWQGGHVMDPCRKSYIKEALEHPETLPLLEDMRSHKFRTPLELQRIFFPLYDAAKKRTILEDVKHFHELRKLFCRHRLPLYLSKASDLQKCLKIRPEMFCFYDEDQFHQELKDFFQQYFPKKSDFELP